MPALRQPPHPAVPPAAVVLVRLMVGPVFLSEGVQKFLFPAEVGAGRFAKIGVPSPEVLAPFVGVVEVVCGALVLLGQLTPGVPVFVYSSLSFEASRRDAARAGAVAYMVKPGELDHLVNTAARDSMFERCSSGVARGEGGD